MIDISKVSLMDLLPPNLRRDSTLAAIAKSLEHDIVSISKSISKLKRFDRLDELTDAEADELAWEFHVDFYDASLPIEQKRQLVKNAIRFHRRKGTPAAVEELITILFGEGKVEEWFEYGGEPGYFRVITNNPEVTLDRAQEFYRAVESVKRLSAHLEEVILSQTESLQLYFGTGMVVNEHIIIR
ncbi:MULTISPECIES: phage tail protein I [Paenibacillus]|uniref:phage tail protein I n=1 Tax=Paenibacillus TaxID=44249 RepID=UPI00119DE217|nr:phage tail protein I [Paenibacillus sp. IHBB 10380]